MVDVGYTLENRTVLITGASGGFGRRFASVFRQAGAELVLITRSEQGVARLREDHPDAVVLRSDLSLDADVGALCARLREGSVAVDVLINNAGTAVYSEGAHDESAEGVRETLEVNLVTPFRLSQAVLPHMRAQGRGSIINIASVAAVVGIGRVPQASYAASKGGLVSLTRELATQWARFGIRVNAICPGFIGTQMGNAILQSPKLRAYIEANSPMGRSGRVEELDGLVHYLASDASSFMTGQAISIDGGWTAR